MAERWLGSEASQASAEQVRLRTAPRSGRHWWARASIHAGVVALGLSDEYAGPLPGAERPAFSYLALGSLPTSLAAIGLLTWLHRSDAKLADVWLERAIGLTLILAALLMLQRVFLRDARVSPAGTPVCRRAGVIAIGAPGCFLVGPVSVDSSSLILALLVLVPPLGRKIGGHGRHPRNLAGRYGRSDSFLPGSSGPGVG